MICSYSNCAYVLCQKNTKNSNSKVQFVVLPPKKQQPSNDCIQNINIINDIDYGREMYKNYKIPAQKQISVIFKIWNISAITEKSAQPHMYILNLFIFWFSDMLGTGFCKNNIKRSEYKIVASDNQSIRPLSRLAITLAQVNH